MELRMLQLIGNRNVECTVEYQARLIKLINDADEVDGLAFIHSAVAEWFTCIDWDYIQRNTKYASHRTSIKFQKHLILSGPAKASRSFIFDIVNRQRADKTNQYKHLIEFMEEPLPTTVNSPMSGQYKHLIEEMEEMHDYEPV
jgi:hypothetical protein